MTTALLAGNPLRTSRSMTEGHDIPDATAVTENGLPLGYEYAEWRVGEAADAGEPGHYDADEQVWVLPAGAPQMGVYTRTRTGPYVSSDLVTDDACF